MQPIDYEQILQYLKAKRSSVIAKLEEAGRTPDETVLRRLAEVQGAIAAVEAEQRDALPQVGR